MTFPAWRAAAQQRAAGILRIATPLFNITYCCACIPLRMPAMHLLPLAHLPRRTATPASRSRAARLCCLGKAAVHTLQPFPRVLISSCSPPPCIF